MGNPKIYSLFFVSVLLVFAYQPDGHAQHTDSNHAIHTEYEAGVDSSSVKQLVHIIREATKRFKNTKEARVAGYRPLGPDMPNMGMHWVNTRIAVERDINFETPSTLTYLSVNGKLKLTGVAYTHPVKSGAEAPSLPLGKMKWHYHSGSLEKEAHGIHTKHMKRDPRKQMNLAMIHVWAWSENPAGIFAADNWSLSFKRFGLNSPKNPSPDISKALFLADDGIEYYLKFVDLNAESRPINRQSIKKIMTESSNKISKVIKTYKRDDRLSADDQIRITKIWKEMWKKIKIKVDDAIWKDIALNLSDKGHDN